MPWVRDDSQKGLSKSRDASLLKWKWYLQKRAKPNSKGLYKLKEDVAFPILSPLPTTFEEWVMDGIFTVRLSG